MRPSRPWVPYLFLLAPFAVFGFAVLVPMAMTAYYSLLEWNGYGAQTFVGWDNFTELAHDTLFRSSFLHVLIYIAVTLVVEVCVGLGLAGLATSGRGTRLWFRTAVFTPVMLPMVVIAVLWSFIYSDDGGKDGNERLFHEYGSINANNWASFILVYPVEERERFAPIVACLEETLMIAPEDAGGKELRTDAFALVNGRVQKDGTPLDCEVYDIPSGLDNGIANWAVIGTGTSDAVTEKETGVWFFGSEGEFMTFIPLDNENEYQDLLWSPAGDRLILVRGSGERPDMFFDVYAEGMEKQAEFSGLREEIAWLDDGMRIVFTRIDGIREGGAFPGLS